jgi:hypothetical protein
LLFLLLLWLCKLGCVKKNATFARERKQRKREGNKSITCKPKFLIKQGRVEGEWPSDRGQKAGKYGLCLFSCLLLLRVRTIKKDKTGKRERQREGENDKERERMTKRVSLSRLLL